MNRHLERTLAENQFFYLHGVEDKIKTKISTIFSRGTLEAVSHLHA